MIRSSGVIDDVRPPAETVFRHPAPPARAFSGARLGDACSSLGQEPHETMTTELKTRFDVVDAAITHWMADHGITVLRLALGIVFVWFGALKLFPGMSPAEDLVRATVPFLPGHLFLPFLGLWEIAIGLGFLTGRALRLTILLLFLQMPGTLAPVVLLPERVFALFPVGLTLEGQYIVKNTVLIAAALVIGATVRGARLVEERSAASGT